MLAPYDWPFIGSFRKAGGDAKQIWQTLSLLGDWRHTLASFSTACPFGSTKVGRLGHIHSKTRKHPFGYQRSVHAATGALIWIQESEDEAEWETGAFWEQVEA